MSDEFGFSGTKDSKKSTKDKLASIQPSRGKEKDVPMAQIDAIAESHGFTTREAQPVEAASSVTSGRSRRKKREMGPRIPINMMVPQEVAEPFIEFCNDNRYTYWEGVEELMRRCGVIRKIDM
ncbi:hypothetical protein [Burkholderia gladioli]|uniref:hypothetical protein n=1 Tax=Burkholderia gladioli TaxID=28095 RepID=UPI0006186B08|nr:hypothetical protein [Burkholderia gladioli]MBW5286520.1 hypothetical protein [Burkholderia gladioli]